MLHRLANFEIDEARRELRSGDKTIEPQRRVFDLLAYLARHADRVIPKAELLENVWSGVLVTDNSLQRAISLARAALNDAGCAAAIRTHQRQGYRLLPSGPPLAGDPADGASAEALQKAKTAFAGGAWQDTVKALDGLARFESLGADDLRFYFHAVQCAGRSDDAIPRFERAATALQAAGDPERAACAAILLAQLLLDNRQPALAKGWLERATRALVSRPEGREHGYLAFARCRLALFEDRLETAVPFADRARDIGERTGDADLHALGLLYGGEARLYLGDVEAGLSAIDEAGAAAIALDLGPWAGGLVFCGIIFSSLTRADWHRASQWNEQFGRWCACRRAPGALGLCRLHRAEVLCVQGRLAAAEREARQALQALSRSAPWAEGDAWRVLGEIQLARGDWAEAHRALTRAHEFGWDAQAGLALLEDAQGRTVAAHRLLSRALRSAHWLNRARRGLLLAHFAEIAARAGRLSEAREALRELDSRPELVASSALEALVIRARAELAAAEGQPVRAVDLLQLAVARWTAIDAPLRAAQTRCRLAEQLRAEGDAASADIELAAAAKAFRRCGASGLLEQCERLQRLAPPARPAATRVRRGA